MMAIELAGVLDMWASVRWQIARGPDRDKDALERWRRLVEIARRCDTDPARDRLRDLWLVRRRLDVDALREIAESIDLDAQTVRTLDLLGITLLASDDRARAVPLLKRIQRTHPDDAWTNWRLSRALSQIHPPQTADGLRYALAAVALRPQSSGLRTNLAWHFVDHGRAQMREGRFADATASLAAVRDLESIPYDVQARAEQLDARCERLQLIEPHFEAILAGSIAPGNAMETNDFAALCAAKGHHLKATELYRRSLERKAGWELPVKQAAARSALLAGFGIGEDANGLDAATKSKLRDDGLTWFEESFGSLRNRDALRRVAREWLSDPDLVSIRTDAGKAKLTREERQRWRALWRKLQSARRRGGG
jgi:tetratricopeptide (TPR) repeat protein